MGDTNTAVAIKSQCEYIVCAGTKDERRCGMNGAPVELQSPVGKVQTVLCDNHQYYFRATRALSVKVLG